MYPQVGGNELASLLHDFIRDAELSVELERAGVDDQGSGRCARFGNFVDDADADAAAREPEREKQSGGTGADDEDLGLGHRKVCEVLKVIDYRTVAGSVVTLVVYDVPDEGERGFRLQ